MINTKEQLKNYIDKDRKNAGRSHTLFYIGDELGKYLLLLRKKEYAYNLSKKTFSKKYIISI